MRPSVLTKGLNSKTRTASLRRLNPGFDRPLNPQAEVETIDPEPAEPDIRGAGP